MEKITFFSYANAFGFSNILYHDQKNKDLDYREQCHAKNLSFKDPTN